MADQDSNDPGNGFVDGIKLTESSHPLFEVNNHSLDLLYYSPFPSIVIQSDRTIIWRNEAWLRTDGLAEIEIDGRRFQSAIPDIERQISKLLESSDAVSTARISKSGTWQFDMKRFLVAPRPEWSGQNAEWTNASLLFIDAVRENNVGRNVARGFAIDGNEALTNVEMKIVESLIRGMSLREASENNGMKYNTARKYLQNIFAKTGVRRQTELIAKLGPGFTAKD